MFKNNIKRAFSSKSGQATIEYLLLVAVVVLLARLILTPLGEGLRQFSGALVGPDGYYACLMENGLIPGFEKITTGGGELDCRNQSIEAQALLTAKIGSINSTLNSSGNLSRTGSNSQANRDKAAAAAKKQAEKNKNSAKNKEKGGDTGASSRSSSNRSAGQNAGQSRISKFKERKRRARVKNRAGSDQGGFESEYAKKSKSAEKRTKKRFKTSRAQGFLGTFYIDDEEELGRPRVFRSESVNQSSSQKNEKKRSFATNSQRKVAEANAKPTEGFALGNFLKYLIIAGIIVSILLVIFSQVMEFQNRD